MKRISAVSLLIAAFAISGCGGKTATEVGNPTEETIIDASVANGAASGINVISNYLTGTTSGISVAAIGGGKKSFIAELLTPIRSAWAALGSGGCSLDDPDVSISVDCSDTDHSARIVIDYGAGCDIGDSVFITGRKAIEWSNMGDDACFGAARPVHFWNAVQGQGEDNSQRTASTDPDNMAEPASDIVRNFSDGASTHIRGYFASVFSDYSESEGVQSVTSTTNVPGTSRIKYDSDGETKIFDHTVSTPESLVALLERSDNGYPVRTIQSGIVRISHNIALFTVDENMDGVKWDYNLCDCQPVSGTVGITVTDQVSGEAIGSGEIVFTYEETGDCGSADFTYDGRPVNLPSLDRCR